MDSVKRAAESTAGESEEKKQRRATTKRLETEVHHLSLFPEILQVYIKHSSDFLETKELGQLLLFTSKRMATWAFPDDTPRIENEVQQANDTDATNDAVWKRLCISQWGAGNGKESFEQYGAHDGGAVLPVYCCSRKERVGPLQTSSPSIQAERLPLGRDSERSKKEQRNYNLQDDSWRRDSNIFRKRKGTRRLL